MRHMSTPFWVLICLLPVLCGIAASGSAAAGPRPDPPPIPKPLPPPPAPQPPPAARYLPVPPPVASGPSASEIAASRLASAARARAARLRTQRARVARARASAARARAQRVKAAREAARNKQIAVRGGVPGVPQGLLKRETPASAADVAFVFASLGAAVLLFGLALIPARAVPWYWAARALVDRRGDLALVGALGLVSAAFFILFQAR